MLYIIDANNLAGKLKILGEKNFDKKLILLIKDHYLEKPSRVILVFDGRDAWGDKIDRGNLQIIYTPKDKYYESADDKIVEVVESELNSGKQELTVITDDRELRRRVEKIAEAAKRKMNLTRATEFAEKLLRNKSGLEKIDEDRGLNEKEIDDINDELLRLWQ